MAIDLVVDTSVWVDLLRGRVTWQVDLLSSRLAAGDRIAITDIVLTELLRGARDESDAQKLADYLEPFEVARLESLDDFRAAAALHRAGRAVGTAIRSTTDCLLAAVCIREQVELLHSDRDFDHIAMVSGLRVVLTPAA